MPVLLTVARDRAIVVKMVALAIVLALLLPAASFAGPLDALDVSLLLQPQGSLEPLLLIAGRLPEGTELPAEIAIPVPEGVEDSVAWAGQILGGPVENDPPAEPSFEVRDGVHVAVFELTQSDIGQIEIVYPAATSVIADDLRAAAFELATPAGAGLVRLAVAVPPGFEVTAVPEGALTSPLESGIVYYYVEFSDAAPGEPLGFGLEYRGQAAPGGAVPAHQGSGSGEIPTFLIVLIGAVLAGALLIVLASRARQDADTDEQWVNLEDEPHATAEDEYLEPVEREELSPVDAEEDAPALSAEYDDAVGADQSAPSGGSSILLSPKVLLIGAALLVLAIFVVLNLAGESGQVGVTDMSGQVVSQRISTASAESEASWALFIPCDCPPEVEAAKMFEALRQVPGVAHASFDTGSFVMSVQFDPSLTGSEAIEERLRAAGYLP